MRQDIKILNHPPENLYLAVRRNAEKNPQKTAVADDFGRRFSYEDLLYHTDQFSRYLRVERGIKAGDHVGLVMYSSVEFAVAYLALIRIGAVSVVFPTKFKKAELSNLVSMADLSFLICEESLLPRIEETKIPRIIYKLSGKEFCFAPYIGETDPEPCGTSKEDVAVMMFTSGTTSQSKGVMLTNGALMAAAEVYRSVFSVTDQDSTVIPVPIYMVTGLNALLGLMLYAGGTVYMQQFFDAKEVLNCIQNEKITFLHTAPTVYSLLCDEKENFPELPSLRLAACGGSRTDRGLEKRMQKWLPGCDFRTVYGMTETSSPALILPECAYRSPHPLSDGVPVPNLEIRFVKDNGEDANTGEIGELWLKGPNLLKEYYKKETESFQNGWLHTGDLGYQTEDGYVYVVDRIKDMINRGGEKVISYDVEQALISIEGIKEAAVVGIPHPVYTEVPVALVVPEKDRTFTEEEIKSILKEQIAGYKIPEKIFFDTNLPLTPNGKVDKKKIRKCLCERSSL